MKPHPVSTSEVRTIVTRAAPQMDGEGKTITGLAAVFYDGTEATMYQLDDDLWERVMPGAFDESLKSDDIRALFNHDPNIVLGRNRAGTLRLTSEMRGLRYEIDAPESSPVIASIKRGDVTESSFSFEPREQNWIKSDDIWYRELRKVRLFDVGPVTFAAYSATTSAVRTAARTEIETLRRPAADPVAARARVVEIQAALDK